MIHLKIKLKIKKCLNHELGVLYLCKTQDKSLIPSVNKNEDVPMSEYQFINYASVEKAEREQDKNKNKSKGKRKKEKGEEEEDIFEIKSSCKAYSYALFFCFPRNNTRPYLKSEGNLIEENDFK